MHPSIMSRRRPGYAGRMRLLSDVQLAWGLFRKGLSNRSAVAAVRRALQTEPAHPPRHYRIAVYFADGGVNIYQMRQWYKPLAGPAQRWPVVETGRGAWGEKVWHEG